MSDYTLPPALTLIVGRSGTGKTTWAIRYLLNRPAACRFVFDDEGQVAGRLGLRHASTAAQLEAALASRWVVFNPHPMFPGDIDRAFRYFCAWVYGVSRRGPGKKLLFVDEIWRRQSPNGIPAELSTVILSGRAEGLELVTATQRPERLNGAISGQVSELVCFHLQGDLPLSAVKEMGGDVRQVVGLTEGRYVSFNLRSGAVLPGSIF